MTEKFDFYLPTQICFGESVIQRIGEKARALGTRALLVTGGMAKKSGALQKVVEPLEKAGVECVLFDKVEPQPGVQTIEEGARLGKTEECDMVVGIGGECPLDAGKVIAALIKDSHRLPHYFGENRVLKQPLPTIAVPLTAGSGTEVTPFSAITVENEFRETATVVSPLICPTLALVDPGFTSSFPAPVTINNAIDALCHCIEAYLSGASQPLTDFLALEGLRRITKTLPEILDAPGNTTYRSEMSFASVLGGIVISQSGMGLVHHMAYPLTLDAGLAHGAANGLLLPEVCRFLLERNQMRSASLARALGVDVGRAMGMEAVEKVVENLRSFVSQFVPTPESGTWDSLTAKIGTFSDRALKSKEVFSTGLPEATRGDIDAIYRSVLLGEG